MKMNKTTLKIISLSLCVALGISTAGATVFALSTKNDKNDNPTLTADSTKKSSEQNDVSKDETVYVLAGADGSVKKIIVSDWIKNGLNSKSINDKSELQNIQNVKGDESYTLGGDNAKVWDAEGNDIYYQGDIQKELPVNIKATYKLDGKTVSPEELAGKSGKVTVRYEYVNNQYETVQIDGKSEKIYVPFAMLTGLMLDNDVFSNVKISNGKSFNDGDRTIVAGIAFPGLGDNLALSKDKFEIPDYVEFTADAKNFKLGMTVTIATNEIFNNIDTSKLDSLDGLDDSLNQLTSAMTQLMNGSSELYNGLCTLLDKSGQLVSGIDKLAEGSKKLKEGTESLDSGVSDLEAGTNELSDGLDKLSANSDSLRAGSKEVFDTLLSSANAQIKTSGLALPELTIENYGTVLNGAISSLDKTNVYNQALAQVTAAVEAKRSDVTAAVTAAVKTQVAEKVIKTATGMDKEAYDKALAGGLLNKETEAAINAEIEQNMNTAETKAAIEQNVELQIQKLIAENMASEEVQKQLTAAEKGAQSLISLKTSLDKYNTFYVGVNDYTSGVDSAAAGARKLKAGVQTLKAGTKQLCSGANELYNGILTLKDGAPALTDGVTKLKDGSLQLSDGLKEFNEKGVKKLTDAVGGNLNGLVTRLRATVDVSKNYKSFSGISDDMDGQVKFIYRTDSIEAKD